tara:strand:+ start:405 stop:614 length:210 start_codon:yes stop_codon:yes gene_type:complete
MGKFSVVRWWILVWFYYGFVVDSYEGEFWHLPNWIRIIIVIHLYIGGPTYLYIFRKNFLPLKISRIKFG